MIPSMNIERYNILKNQFYDYFSQIKTVFDDPDGFINFLVNDTGFFELPATTHDNCNYKGGLLEHSLNITKILVDLNYFIANKKYTLEQCIFHGLFYNLKFSYYKGHFPFIYDLDKYWVWNENVNFDNLFKKNLLKNEMDLSEFINEDKFETTVEFKILLNFAELWASMHEPFISYRKLESEELILSDDYL